MQQPADDERSSMEEALAAIRGIFAEQESSQRKSEPAEPTLLDKDTDIDGLLSREAVAAVNSSVSRLTENMRKLTPSLEDVVREALRPVLTSWVNENLPDMIERMVQAEIARVIRGR
jgi:cell pole-organizing protein PopZ